MPLQHHNFIRIGNIQVLASVVVGFGSCHAGTRSSQVSNNVNFYISISLICCYKIKLLNAL